MAEESYADYLNRISRASPEGQAFAREKVAAMQDLRNQIGAAAVGEMMREVKDWSAVSPNLERGPANAPSSTQQSKTGFNIGNFRTELEDSGGGILPTHSYHVVFSPFTSGISANLSRFITAKKERLILRADRVNLPGPTLLKQENVRRYGYGPVEQVAYGVQFGELSIQWVVDKNAELVAFFNHWMSLVVNFDSKGGGDMNSPSTITGYRPYEIGYKDNYSNRQMNIFVYDRKLDQTIIYEVYDVFPIAINDTALSWGETDQSLKLDVRFTFTDYSIRTPLAGDVVRSAQGVGSSDPSLDTSETRTYASSRQTITDVPVSIQAIGDEPLEIKPLDINDLQLPDLNLEVQPETNISLATQLVNTNLA